MKYSIVYRSLSGNTKKLAETIREELEEHECVYFGEPDEQALDAETIYVGFWTDKGSCDQKIKDFLHLLHGKDVYLFGTAGFGREKAYFERILKSVMEEIPEDNQKQKGFMCQGKMPVSVRTRYENMLKEHPDDAGTKMLIENFDEAVSHPDKKDLEALKTWIQR